MSKKDLTNPARFGTMARATPSRLHFAFALAPPRQNFNEIKGLRDFFRERDVPRGTWVLEWVL
jgi:hypothetical protein